MTFSSCSRKRLSEYNLIPTRENHEGMRNHFKQGPAVYDQPAYLPRCKNSKNATNGSSCSSNRGNLIRYKIAQNNDLRSRGEDFKGKSGTVTEEYKYNFNQ